eukprot:TRINITY_DN2722_c0_g2_i2.p1 TRINITY_DN2722_c0_g2~~TRINITY_DN2722_c0_g2_i2.p1  ORF type:complete len:477 (+),score=95.33 TRINITY_DN2722_c0_g2_i2:149-1579(+)
MSEKIQLSIGILLLLIWRVGASGIIERDSLKYFPAQDFAMMGKEFKETPKQNYTSETDSTKLIMIETEISELIATTRAPDRIRIEEKYIEFFFRGLAFVFNVTYLYEYSVLGFPFTGTMKLRYTYSSVMYTLHLENNNSFYGTLTGITGGILVHNDNPFVGIMGINPLLNGLVVKIMLRHTNILRKCLNKSIKKYYKKTFGNHTATIKFPDLGNTEVLVHSKYLSVKMRKGIGLQFFYEDTMSNEKIAAEPISAFDPDKEYLRKITYEYDLLTKIIQDPLSTIKNLRITEANITSDSSFHLTKQTLAIVFPNIMLMDISLTDIAMTFTNIRSNINSTHHTRPQTFIFADIVFRFAVSGLLDGKEALLFDSEVGLDLFTQPVFDWMLRDLQVNFNLNVTSTYVKMRKVHFINSAFDVANINGIPNLMRLYIDEYLIPAHEGLRALGNGLNVTTLYQIDPEESKPVLTDTSIEITLYE